MGMKKQGVNFSKYLLIGIFVTVLTVGLSWFFIDIFGMLALLSSTIVETLGFFIKYFSYRKIKLIKKSLKKFLLINIGSNIAFILLSSLLIDILKFQTLIAIPAIIIFLFLLRYLAFYLTKMIVK